MGYDIQLEKYKEVLEEQLNAIEYSLEIDSPMGGTERLFNAVGDLRMAIKDMD